MLRVAGLQGLLERFTPQVMLREPGAGPAAKFHFYLWAKRLPQTAQEQFCKQAVIPVPFLPVIERDKEEVGTAERLE
jgi:hypothetical protein